MLGGESGSGPATGSTGERVFDDHGRYPPPPDGPDRLDDAVCLRPDGHPDFHALQSRQACREARLMAFDVPALDGSFFMPLLLHKRRKQLAASWSKLRTVCFSRHVEGEWV